MTEATRRTPGTPCWVSLMVHGLDAIQIFYGELFGWEFRPGPRQLGPYVRAFLHGKEVGGLGRLPVERHLPVAWTPYLSTDDADATTETIRSSGGTVGVGPINASNACRMAIVSDPSGAIFGLWQPAAHGGIAPPGSPGTPVWHELVTFETTAMGKFYETVFGYQVETVKNGDSGGTDRSSLRLSGQAVAELHGVGRALPPDRGPHWMTYFEVADADEAAQRVTALGGRVLRPPSDGPRGRVATVADPEGGVFTVIRSNL
ncbi:VOC family protein [Streptomyces jumonjinensis]|uniref:VOC family protein n=1 Tax=Streptomyces jumonjinensis TaxID=1945 RepID=UPI0037920319